MIAEIKNSKIYLSLWLYEKKMDDWVHSVSPAGHLSTVCGKSGAHWGQTQDSGSSHGVLQVGPCTLDTTALPFLPGLISNDCSSLTIAFYCRKISVGTVK